MATFITTNPADETTLETFSLQSDDEVERAVGAADAAFRRWRRAAVGERASLARALAGGLRADRERLARVAVLEMGKPISQAEAEIDKCATACEQIADAAADALAPRATPAGGAHVEHEPLGVVLGVMPWNFPYWQVFRAAIPALVAGNAFLLKHAPNVTRCALEIEALFARAGAPQGLFHSLVIDVDRTGALVDDERVVGVTVTGSERAGAAMASRAGAAIKPSVLELGGSDPFIVLADADVDRAARAAARSRFQNNGQSCIAAKRFVVASTVARAFVDRLVAEAGALRVGDPSARDTGLGPLARADLRDNLARQVEASLAAGAVARCGATPARGKGYFYPATVLTDAPLDAAVLTEETFGPVAAVVVVRDEDEAIAIANATRFGLGASLWSRDVERARGLAREIEAGSVFINAMVASDARAPFGGVKKSGYGRELAGEGIHAFTNTKTISIEEGAPVSTVE